MRFRDDTRGVTVQIGAVLLFATIIIALATYQATVVPAQNADVEYQHSQTAQNQLTDVRNALLRTASSGNALPASVTLGTQYPSRVFLMNPPPAAGSLGTEQYDGNSTVSVSNVNATDDETAEFFAANGNAWSASTKYLAYQPGYHEYDGAPNLLFEATVLSNHYPDQNASVPLTDQILVDGDTITLVALNGSMSTSRTGSVSVDTTPVSAPYTAVQVEPENDGAPVNVTVPTHVDADTLANATNLGDRENVTVTDAGDGRVSIELSGDGPFTLKTAKLGVGSNVAQEGAAYLTLVENDDDSVTVEARDRFNNPVGGVNVSVDGSNPFEESSQSTTADGRATFEVADGESGEATLEILDGQAHERVTVRVDSRNTTGGAGSDAYLVDWMPEKSTGENAGLSCDGDNCTFDASVTHSVDLFADSSPVVDDGTFWFAVGNTSVGSVSPPENTTTHSGVSSTEFTPDDNGTTNVYVSGGGSGDRLELTVENFEDTASDGQTLQAVEREGVNSGTQLTYTVENAGSEEVTVASFSVDATTVDAGAQINNGDSDELRILRANQPGFANRDGPGNSPTAKFDADGSTYELAIEGSEATLVPSDDDVIIDFRGFNTDLGTLAFTDSEANADVVVTLVLSDGSEQEFYFEQQ